MISTTLNKFNRIVLIFLLGLMVFLSGCRGGTLDTLSGTVWKGQTLFFEHQSTLIFQDGIFTIIDIDPSSYEENSVTGTYTYDHPNVTLDAPGLSVEAKVKGNKIDVFHYTILGAGVGVADIYTKQTSTSK